ncbi:hypothetical protein BVG19_g222 [[Candida] boidinii]|nr:hypothetical protein BVG19_g222 [[Candida] boidinii]OWB49793.1 phosphatase activity protein [[Candida] boidinii]
MSLSAKSPHFKFPNNSSNDDYFSSVSHSSSASSSTSAIKSPTNSSPSFLNKSFTSNTVNSNRNITSSPIRSSTTDSENNEDINNRTGASNTSISNSSSSASSTSSSSSNSNSTLNSTVNAPFKLNDIKRPICKNSTVSNTNNSPLTQPNNLSFKISTNNLNLNLAHRKKNSNSSVSSTSNIISPNGSISASTPTTASTNSTLTVKPNHKYVGSISSINSDSTLVDSIDDLNSLSTTNSANSTSAPSKSTMQNFHYPKHGSVGSSDTLYEIHEISKNLKFMSIAENEEEHKTDKKDNNDTVTSSQLSPNSDSFFSIPSPHRSSLKTTVSKRLPASGLQRKVGHRTTKSDATSMKSQNLKSQQLQQQNQTIQQTIQQIQQIQSQKAQQFVQVQAAAAAAAANGADSSSSSSSSAASKTIETASNIAPIQPQKFEFSRPKSIKLPQSACDYTSFPFRSSGISGESSPINLTSKPPQSPFLPSDDNTNDTRNKIKNTNERNLQSPNSASASNIQGLLSSKISNQPASLNKIFDGSSTLPKSGLFSSSLSRPSRFKDVNFELPKDCEILDLEKSVDLIKSSEDDVGEDGLSNLLVIDVRPFQDYCKSHIRGSLNLCLPSTLLKRSTFKLDRCIATLTSDEKGILKKYLLRDSNEFPTVLFYDYSTDTGKEASLSISNLALKFSDSPEWKGKLFVVKGGFKNFNSVHPDLVGSETFFTTVHKSKLNDKRSPKNSSFITEKKNAGDDSNDNCTTIGNENGSSDALGVPSNRSQISISSNDSGNVPLLSSTQLVTDGNNSFNTSSSSLNTSKDTNFSPTITSSSVIYSSPTTVSTTANKLPEITIDAYPISPHNDVRRLKARATSSFQSRSPVSATLGLNHFILPDTSNIPFFKTRHHEEFLTPRADGSLHLNTVLNTPDKVYLPTWLSNVIGSDLGATELSKKFHDIQVMERSRLNNAMCKPNTVNSYDLVKNSSSSPFSDVETPSFSAGVELGRKNRYKDIFPYDHSRVKIKKYNDSGENELDQESEYINASYLNAPGSKNSYIATQGPLEETIGDFWKVVVDHNIQLIFSLTAQMENEVEKCAPYWLPGTYASNGVFINVDCLEEIKHFKITPNSNCDVIVRRIKINISSDNEKSHEVLQIHILSWPDFGAVINSFDLISLVYLRKYITSVTKTEDCPILVHCSAGCGRTGCFSAIDACIDILLHENNEDIKKFMKAKEDQQPSTDASTASNATGSTEASTTSTNTVNTTNSHISSKSVTEERDLVYDIVCAFRSQRVSMVQNLKQYILIYDTILLFERIVKEGFDKYFKSGDLTDWRENEYSVIKNFLDDFRSNEKP